MSADDALGTRRVDRPPEVEIRAARAGLRRRLLVAAALASAAGCGSTSAPRWVHEPYGDAYPPERFLCATAPGAGPEADAVARERAFDAIASQIETTIEAETSSLDAIGQSDGDWTVRSEFSRVSRTQVRQVLTGVSVVRKWADRETGNTFVHAVVDRDRLSGVLEAQAAERLAEAIDRIAEAQASGPSESWPPWARAVEAAQAGWRAHLLFHAVRPAGREPGYLGRLAGSPASIVAAATRGLESLVAGVELTLDSGGGQVTVRGRLPQPIRVGARLRTTDGTVPLEGVPLRFEGLPPCELAPADLTSTDGEGKAEVRVERVSTWPVRERTIRCSIDLPAVDVGPGGPWRKRTDVTFQVPSKETSYVFVGIPDVRLRNADGSESTFEAAVRRILTDAIAARGFRVVHDWFFEPQEEAFLRIVRATITVAEQDDFRNDTSDFRVRSVIDLYDATGVVEGSPKGLLRTVEETLEHTTQVESWSGRRSIPETYFTGPRESGPFGDRNLGGLAARVAEIIDEQFLLER